MRVDAAQLPTKFASDQGRIPVLDIGPYLAGDPGAAAPLARAVAYTCQDTGFLVIANHGIPYWLVEDTFAVAARFFARPETEKLALKIGKYNIGYLPFGGQVVRQFTCQPKHQAELQRKLLHSPATAPPIIRTSSGRSRLSVLTGGHQTCPNSTPRRRRTMPRWRR
jgi:isopenicillin N synthase-like dioxygenase